jgi:glycosyltransferase
LARLSAGRCRDNAGLPDLACMKISIITVAFNSAATIGDTLRSVSTQDHPDIEHIVIDGNSQDATLQVISLSGSHVAHVVSEPDHGIYDAMNKGLGLATGELVGFLNADDTFAHSRVLSSIANAAQRHPEAHAVYGDLVYVRDDRTLRTWRSGAFSRARLAYGWMPPHPTFYLRRTRLADLGFFNDSLRIAADYDFMLRCLSRPQAQAAYVPDVLVKMRVGGASNRSLKAMVRKSSEDLQVLRDNKVGGVLTLLCKNLRKLPQFL